MKSECKYSFLEAKAKIESFCAYQERCHYEVSMRLQSWGIVGEQQDQLIADLITNRFLNEERFVESFASGKFRIKRWGKIKIRQHLKKRFISEYSIKRGLAAIDDADYMGTLYSLAAVKTIALDREKDPWVKKAKIVRYLSSKGYEQDLIFDVLEEIAKRDFDFESF